MLAPQIEYSDREERIEFIQERFHCKAPSCGGCGSCNLPDGVPVQNILQIILMVRSNLSNSLRRFGSRGGFLLLDNVIPR